MKGSLQSYGGESGVNWNLGRSHGCKHMRPSDLPDGPRGINQNVQGHTAITS